MLCFSRARQNISNMGIMFGLPHDEGWKYNTPDSLYVFFSLSHGDQQTLDLAKHMQVRQFYRTKP